MEIKKPKPILNCLGVFRIEKNGAIKIKHVTLVIISKKYSSSSIGKVKSTIALPYIQTEIRP